jgi:hypothetical protein
MHFAIWATNKEGPSKTRFSDDAYCHLHGIINKQNIQFWAMEHPHQIQETELW